MTISNLHGRFFKLDPSARSYFILNSDNKMWSCKKAAGWIRQNDKIFLRFSDRSPNFRNGGTGIIDELTWALTKTASGHINVTPTGSLQAPTIIIDKELDNLDCLLDATVERAASMERKNETAEELPLYISDEKLVAELLSQNSNERAAAEKILPLIEKKASLSERHTEDRILQAWHELKHELIVKQNIDLVCLRWWQIIPPANGTPALLTNGVQTEESKATDLRHQTIKIFAAEVDTKPGDTSGYDLITANLLERDPTLIDYHHKFKKSIGAKKAKIIGEIEKLSAPEKIRIAEIKAKIASLKQEKNDAPKGQIARLKQQLNDKSKANMPENPELKRLRDQLFELDKIQAHLDERERQFQQLLDGPTRDIKILEVIPLKCITNQENPFTPVISNAEKRLNAKLQNKDFMTKYYALISTCVANRINAHLQKWAATKADNFNQAAINAALKTVLGSTEFKKCLTRIIYLENLFMQKELADLMGLDDDAKAWSIQMRGQCCWVPYPGDNPIFVFFRNHLQRKNSTLKMVDTSSIIQPALTRDQSGFTGLTSSVNAGYERCPPFSVSLLTKDSESQPDATGPLTGTRNLFSLVKH